MKSIFQCPSCQQPLQKAYYSVPPKEPYFTIWCGNVSRCPSERAANDGGSGPTEEAAYRSLLLAVKHEEDQQTEQECEPLSPEDLKDKNEWRKADDANKREREGV